MARLLQLVTQGEVEVRTGFERNELIIPRVVVTAAHGRGKQRYDSSKQLKPELDAH